MKRPEARLAQELLAAEFARVRLVSTLASIVCAHVYLGLVGTAPEALTAGAVALVIGGSAVRALDLPPGASARRQALSVGASSLLGTLGSTLLIALTGLESVLSTGFPGVRSLLAAAFVYAPIAAMMTAFDVRLVAARAAFAADRQTRFESSPSPATRTRAIVSPLLLGMSACLVSLVVLLCDGVARAIEQGFGPLRVGMLVLVLGILWFAVGRLLLSWLGRGLELSFEREEVEAEVRVRTLAAAVGDDIEAIGERAARAEAASRTLLAGCESQRGEQRQATEFARVAASNRASVLERTSGIAERLESSRRGIAAERGRRTELDAQFDAWSGELEAIARQLDSNASHAAKRRSGFERLTDVGVDAAASVAEVVQAVRSFDEAASSIAAAADAAARRAEAGRASFEQTVTGLEAIREASTSAQAAIHGLAERTREIAGVLDVIEDVGDQTSLLALNAAIIAAQAGEQGRAFSVVADEIRDLADRVLGSAKEIADLIRSLELESERAREAVALGATRVAREVALSAEALQTLDATTLAAKETVAVAAPLDELIRVQSNTLEHAASLAARIEPLVAELETSESLALAELASLGRSVAGQIAGVARLRESSFEREGAIDRAEEDLSALVAATRSLAGSPELRSDEVLALVQALSDATERIEALGAIGLELSEGHRALSSQIEVVRARRRSPQAPPNGSEARVRAEGGSR